MKEKTIDDIEINFIEPFKEIESLDGLVFIKELNREKETKWVNLHHVKQFLAEKLDGMKNPYPKDIFRWNNKEKLKFNRGRFNRHCYEIYEFAKEDLKKELLGEN